VTAYHLPRIMGRIKSGINDLDGLIDSLYAGDNVVWEIEAGTSPEVFLQHFMRQSFADDQNVIYISFNKSPQSILQQIGNILSPAKIKLLDCFTSGKGKNDTAFTRFYENYDGTNVIKVDEPGNITYFTTVLDSIEDSLPTGTRYVFDSLTGMQDLWGDEKSTYKFFTYMCPRLYDLGTVAYWLLEKEAHSQAFKANLRHITQVVLELYKRRDKLFIKAMKLDGRSSREAFKPHPYEIDADGGIAIIPARKEPSFNIGAKIKELRVGAGMSQKELADRVELTPSYISQLENNQISPSLNSFIQICNALGIAPGAVLENKGEEHVHWLIRKESIYSNLFLAEDGLSAYRIVKNGSMSGTIFVLGPHAETERPLLPEAGSKLVYVLKGDISVVIGNKGKKLGPGDSVYLKKEIPSLWKNEGGDKAELLLLCS
jgi:transcriptional regulator with XRE-family HTH domain/KaiC/GvpD/RAD55 family RecA-like ATPase